MAGNSQVLKLRRGRWLGLSLSFRPRNSSVWPLFAFMDKVLLEHGTLICPCMMYGCFHAVMARLSSSDRYHMACKAENIY